MSDSTSASPVIGFIGLGVMGGPMAGHLLAAGHSLVVSTRTRRKAESLLAAGAEWADRPCDVAERADVVVSIVGLPSDVESVHLGPEGTLAASSPPDLLIDMTTSRPSLAVEIARRATEVGARSVDAPVSGGDVGARNATLSIMVGGADEDVQRALPVLQILGSTIVHHGPPGAGQHAKVVNQILGASVVMGVCEGLLYADAAGLDGERIIESVGSGASGSWAIQNLGPRILAGDFDPGFLVEHFIKDLGIALDEARAMNLALPAVAQVTQFYEAARGQGLGRHGTQVLYRVLSGLNGRA